MDVAAEGRSAATSAWQLEFVRLVAFPATPPLFTDQHWWEDLAAEQPGDFVSTRKKHSREDRGSFQGAILSLSVDLSRVAWLVEPAGEPVELTGNLPVLGPLQEKVDWFIDLLTPWLANSCPPLVRLAFAGKVLRSVANAKEAYQVLAAHLPRVNLDPNPNDFLIQINRRKASTVVDGLLLNRVCTWSKFSVTYSVDSPAGTPFSLPGHCYSTLELDINTAPERTEILPPQSLPRLFRELASLGVEIAERGDSP
jgi:hypothetical protein